MSLFSRKYSTLKTIQKIRIKSKLTSLWPGQHRLRNFSSVINTEKRRTLTVHDLHQIWTTSPETIIWKKRETQTLNIKKREHRDIGFIFTQSTFFTHQQRRQPHISCTCTFIPLVGDKRTITIFPKQFIKIKFKEPLLYNLPFSYAFFLFVKKKILTWNRRRCTWPSRSFGFWRFIGRNSGS